MERTAVGISGFDQLVEGGLPKGSTILLTGFPGTGKTIFGLQYLYEGARKGENGLYVTLDSSIDIIRDQAKQFNWNVEELEKNGKLFFLKVPLDKMKLNIFQMIEGIKQEIGAKRLVFDNLATFAVNIDLFTIPRTYAGNVASSVSLVAGATSTTEGRDQTSEEDRISYSGNAAKRMIYLIIERLESLGTTNLLINYGNQEGTRITKDGVSEFMCDGIIQLFNHLIGNKRLRTMTVLKMRDTNHSQYIHNFEIGENGIIIHPSEQVY